MTAQKPAAPVTGTPIPVPPGFPVKWDDEIEPTLLWTWDNFHAPLPRTPMTETVGEVTRSGMEQASKDMGSYRPAGRRKTINGYPYSASAPNADEGTDGKKDNGRDNAIDRAIEALRSRWDSEWRPELEADLAAMKAVKWAELDAAALWATVEHFLDLHRRHWYIHHMVVLPVIQSADRLEKAFAELAGEEEKSSAHVLLHGTETMTVRSIKGLDALAEAARRSAAVKRALEEGTGTPETLAALEKSAEGRAWLKKLRVYLHDFGYRCTGFDLLFPSWAEDPSFVLQVVRSRLKSGAAAHQRDDSLMAEREQLLAHAREAGKAQPELLEKFEGLYARAQQLWPLKEDHSHYIDQASTALVRIALAEVGRRLARAGVLASPDDIWFLTLKEAEAALGGDPANGLQKLVTERRATRDRYSKLTPPKYLGAFPPDHEAAASVVSVNGAGGHEQGATLRGTAASRGEASGFARVVLSPDDFHKVQKGDVLVCRSTAPMWTPLFEIVSALVSEAGGILSHPAVVAREFNLPAVVGVPGATSLIRDGQPIRVSGTDGLVHTGG